ncbi:uncharacterized protein LOC124945041 [Impatiens glandulifera]|uniref:uncharacterized protein LOC124945041 n=1 Tax=Impatiens glandulifera TaxID=253017 RepID=UPI001FB0614C|nr:uncharacterized protein LOC124945041 [Impatiens glandulifera]
MDTDRETRSIDSLEVRSGEKRSGDGELECPLPKKARNGQVLVGSVNKVAEMALVLAALAEMRAGRSPTAVERRMMMDARERLARVCECFAPKDVFPREAFGSIIDDLGLNELKEQKLGFRPPKMTISEKLLFTKQKMEKTEEFSVHSAVPSSQQSHLAMATEGRTPMNITRISSSDKPVHAQVSSGAIQPAKPVASPYQVSASEVRASVVSGGLPASLVGKDSPTSFLPRADKPHLRSDTRSNGPSYTSPVQASVPGGKMMAKPQDWSRQTGPDSRLLQQPFPKAHGNIKLEGNISFDGSRITYQSMSSKPVNTQVPSSSLPVMRQSVQMVQPPLLNNNHIEIGKLVHKLLQPKTGHPAWTPPSRDYMNKAITCDVCKITINDLDNVLVCDSCEKGYHLKCLQSHNQKVIPRGEWHCFQCLSLSNGKPLPPKYGRVTRNMSTHKAPSNSTDSHPSAEKKAEIFGVLKQKNVIANGTAGIQSSSADSINQENNQLTSTAEIPNVGEMRADDTVSSKDGTFDKCRIETYSIVTIRQPQLKPDLAPAATSLSNENSIKRKQITELNGKPQAEPSEKMDKMSSQSQTSSDSNNMDNNQLSSCDGIPLNESHDNNRVSDSGKCNGGGTFGKTLNHAIKLNPDRVAQVPNTVNTNAHTDLSDKSNSDGSLDITWIGNILEVVDDQNYYQSCCINGTVYRLHQYALFPSAKGKLMPSKIQAMWEDIKTGLKWVNVNLCYFPDELPETIGRPCSRESNEVFESNHGQNIMASLLRGPCEVLPPGRFNEENERRSRSGTGTTYRLQPIFLCKWFFDEKKGVFRDVLT